MKIARPQINRKPTPPPTLAAIITFVGIHGPSLVDSDVRVVDDAEVGDSRLEEADDDTSGVAEIVETGEGELVVNNDREGISVGAEGREDAKVGIGDSRDCCPCPDTC